MRISIKCLLEEPQVVRVSLDVLPVVAKLISGCVARSDS